jgi:hypothetical protein
MSKRAGLAVAQGRRSGTQGLFAIAGGSFERFKLNSCQFLANIHYVKTNTRIKAL